MMTRLLLLLLSVACFTNSPAQNLVSNGGFEERNICTEFHVLCAPEGWFRIPLDPVSTGKGTAGFLAGNHHENIVMENIARPGIFRTYLYTRLLCPLEKGREYVFTASFRIQNNEMLRFVDLAWLDFEPFHFQDRISKSRQKMSITPDNKTIDQELGWKQYSIHFTATGEEQYLLIGNLGKTTFMGKPQMRSLVIYEMDNVSVFPADNSIKSCKEININKAFLYQHNYRHTPGKFIDDDEPVEDAPPEIKKDSVIPVPPPTLVPPVVNDTFIVPDVLFKFDKSELKPAFANRLDTLIDKIKTRTFKRIEVLGHTDSLGNDAYNKNLSLSRAETVKKYLIDHLHYDPATIVTKGFAATIPVTSNATSAGRQRNRRVEIVLVK
jgi:outer membrane protein OmpA-like peptidoglycan-associated protein